MSDFQKVLAAAPTPMVVIDATDRLVFINASASSLFGADHQELIGESFHRLVSVIAGDAVGHRRDGRAVALALTHTDLPDSHRLVTIADVSERRRTEDELRRSNAELEQFAYIASHDLQEPLRMVVSYTELLQQRYQGRLDEKADKYIYYAVDGAKRMQLLVSDLLEYSRVGSQGKALTIVSSDRVLESVLSALGPLMRDTGASISASFLPEVMADEGQLRQLLQNLIGNAIKFRSALPPKIVLGATRDHGRWVFYVQDNGIGIDMQYAERIFQMFQRLHERGKFAGSGIGLAIVKRIVERHGGKIWLQSAPGVGSTFYFTLEASEERA